MPGQITEIYFNEQSFYSGNNLKNIFTARAGILVIKLH